jgi:hypothetical protein
MSAAPPAANYPIVAAHMRRSNIAANGRGTLSAWLCDREAHGMLRIAAVTSRKEHTPAVMAPMTTQFWGIERIAHSTVHAMDRCLMGNRA